MYTLQSRWKLEGRRLVYYGLRNKENMFRNTIRISNRQAVIIAAMPCALGSRERLILRPLLGKQIIPVEQVRAVPRRIQDARFCSRCSANDFMIPGLEFSEDGLCPMCQTAEETKSLRSIVPLVQSIPRSKDSRFDVGLFYTGGKDSTYLLYYLAKVLGLRVLAMT